MEIKPPRDVKPYMFRDFIADLLATYKEGSEITAKKCADQGIGGVRDEETAAKYLEYIREKYSHILHLKGPFIKPGKVYVIGCSPEESFEMQLEALETQFIYGLGNIAVFIAKLLRPSPWPRPPVPKFLDEIFNKIYAAISSQVSEKSKSSEEDLANRAQRLLRLIELERLKANQ
ncbi:MAG: hypothetical protein QW707_06045 [Candidatus Bathyarchaeia archaeon]